MSPYAITRTLPVPFADAVERTRTALADQGFGVLTEIDVAATMKAKLDVDVPQQLILGACNPPLAHRALQTEESIGVLLPCNVVVRAGGPSSTIVEAIDPSFLVAATANPGLESIAGEVSAKLLAALDALGQR